MDRNIFEASHQKWPLRYTAEFGKIGYHELGMIRQPETRRMLALVRDVKRDAPEEFVQGVGALNRLKAKGVGVVPNLPFVSEGGTFLAAKYVEGPNLWDAREQQIIPMTAEQQTNALEHAKNLGSYFLESFQQRQPYLADIISPFQYAMIDDKPTLLDLELHTVVPNPENPDPYFDSRILAGNLCSIGEHYGGALTPEQQEELAASLEGMMRAYDPALTLMTEDGTTYDFERWQWFEV